MFLLQEKKASSQKIQKSIARKINKNMNTSNYNKKNM